MILSSRFWLVDESSRFWLVDEKMSLLPQDRQLSKPNDGWCVGLERQGGTPVLDAFVSRERLG